MTHKWKFFKDEKPPHCEEFTNFEVIHKKGYCAELTRWGDYWYCSNTNDANLVMWRPISESGNGGEKMYDNELYDRICDALNLLLRIADNLDKIVVRFEEQDRMADEAAKQAEEMERIARRSRVRIKYR